MRKPTTSQRVLSALISRNSYSFYFLFLLYGLFTLFYYFGELVDFAGWEALRWSFFYGVHDIHRLLFLALIIYAGYIFGIKATIIITIISLMTFLPRGLFISPYPDPLARMLVFTLIAGIMGYLTAIVRREFERRTRLEALLRSERDKLAGILERMADGVLIVDPDYHVRYMNPSMIRDFGESVGSPCYKYLRRLSEPCRDICRLPDVTSGKIERWEYHFPNGRTYEVSASPYRDTDGVVCQLTTFRSIGQRKGIGANLENSRDSS